MLNIKDLLSKKKDSTTSTSDAPAANSDKVVPTISNWYSDRYNSIAIQRNLLLALLAACVFLVIISTFIVGSISSTFKIQPFVIEVEDKTGLTSIVNPLANRGLIANQVLNKYFLTRYVKARESYNFETWKYNYLTVVRLLSSPAVYSGFRRFINTSLDSPLALYGNQMSTYVVFRSVQFFPPSNQGPTNDPKAVIRFTIFPTQGRLKNSGTGNRIHKILTLTYKYEQTEMNDEDRTENPLGFYVTSYVTSVENLEVSVVKNVDK
jgi:type IV secretion system protein VirB8